MRVCHKTEEDLFRKKIEQWVEAGISAGAKDFDDLLSRLPGIYPTEIYPALSALHAKSRLDSGTLVRLRPVSSARRQMSPSVYSSLPPPHPLDFEWRFADQGTRLLLDLAVDLCLPGERLVLLGTPGLALQALSRPRERPTVFWGEDNSITRRLISLNRQVDCPLSMQISNLHIGRCGGAGVVILDPPWYTDYIFPMLATAASICKVGGYVLISLPPDGTRASAVEDRIRVQGFAEGLGLRVVSNRALELVYETPFFEKNALAAYGLQVKGNWRRGDLFVLRKVVGRDGPIASGRIRRKHWCEIEIGRMRLFVDGVSANKGQVLQRLVPGGILPTVSRRDPRRSQVQVWTSGNRVFTSSMPNLVVSAARAASGVPFNSAIRRRLCSSLQERNAVEHLADRLQVIAAIEAEEENLSTS